MDAVDISEFGKKVFIFNNDLCDIALSLKNFEYDCVPSVIALLALFIINVKLWDWLKFPEDIVKPPFRAILPCVEAAGQWSLSNMAMTCVLCIKNFTYESFNTIQEEKHNMLWLHVMNIFKGQKETQIKNHLGAPFLLTLCLSLALLFVSIMIQKKQKPCKKM